MTAQLVVNHERTIGSTDWMRIRSDVGDEGEFAHVKGQAESMTGEFTLACSKTLRISFFA